MISLKKICTLIGPVSTRSARGGIHSEEMIEMKCCDQMVWDFFQEIFRIHEQFAAGELNQSGGSYRFLY